MFGHRDVSDAIQEKLEQAVERLYLEHDISVFYVGYHGMFDSYAGAAVKAVRKQFPKISLYCVIPYHPAVRPIELLEGYDGSFYPPLERVPPRYAIPKANQYMISVCGAVICYVKHCGNSKTLLNTAIKRAKNNQLILENIGQYFIDDDNKRGVYKA